jgi:ankyrin repeat protein
MCLGIVRGDTTCVCAGMRAKKQETALSLACLGGHVECVKFLLQRGENVLRATQVWCACFTSYSIAPQDWLPPVSIAAREGNLQMLEALLDHGVSAAQAKPPAAPNLGGRSTLILSYSPGRSESAERGTRAPAAGSAR